MSKEQAMKEYVEKLIQVRVAILHFCYPRISFKPTNEQLLKQAGDADSQAHIDEIEKA